MTYRHILAILLIVVVVLFQTSLAQYGIPPIGIDIGGYGPGVGYGGQGGYGRGGYPSREVYGPPGRGYGRGGYGGYGYGK